MEEPAAPGSNQLPLEEVALQPPDADVRLPAGRSALAPQSAAPAASGSSSPLLFPPLTLDLFSLPSVSTNAEDQDGDAAFALEHVNLLPESSQQRSEVVPSVHPLYR